MIDKLPLLQKKAREKGFDLDLQEEKEETNEEDPMNKFAGLISQAQSVIKFIELKTNMLYEIKPEVDSAFSNEQASAASAKIETIVNEVHKKQMSMKDTIESLNTLLEESKQEDPNQTNPEVRIKQNLFGSMTKKYQDVCLKFQTIESEIKTIMQTKIIRSAENITGKELNDEEKAQILENPQQVQDLIADKLKGTAHVKLQNAVADLEDRHKNLKNLEKSILQVHNLVIELSKLIQLQGEMIDNIEANIMIAKDYVQSGEKDLVKAKKNMQSARKKKCIILIIVVVILAVIIIPICVKFA